MLAEAFTHLSPQLVERYRALLAHEVADSPELDHLHQLYTEYALRDLHLPRPVLAYFGYHALSDAVDFTDVDRIGDGLVLPQLLRDVLAIRDDVVDEDGAFPGVIDHDKDTLGEIANLRRTVPLALLSLYTDDPDVRELLAAEPPLPEADTWRLREALWNSSVPSHAVQLCARLLREITPVVDDLPIGKATTAYLRDLIQHRLISTVERLRNVL